MNTIRAGLLLSLTLTSLMSMGCSRTPTLSATGYQQTLALVNTCQRKDEAALQRLQDALTKAVESSQVSTEEASALQAALDKAKKGDWETAASRARTLLDGQASSAPPPGAGSSSGQSRHAHGSHSH